MQEVFEKIIEKLKEYEYENLVEHDSEMANHCKQDCNDVNDCTLCVFDKAIEIIKQEAEKLVPDTNVGNNGWVPCSERLPEENSSVIACFAHGLVTELAFYGGLFHGIYDYNTNVIIAWQPLPQPYQPKGE